MKNKYTLSVKYEIFLREKLRFNAQSRLSRKYEPPSSFYNIKLINDLIFNEETHLVLLFREYCTFHNTNEYLRRFYFKEESFHKIPKLLSFYATYSKIYPNYTSIPESKFMYKNIKRKQKMIDNIQNFDDNNRSHFSYSDIFTSKARNSINSQTFSLNNIPTHISNNTQNSSISYSIIHLISNIDKIDKGEYVNQNKDNINAHINIMYQSGNKQHIVMSSLGKYKSLGHTHFFSKYKLYNKKTISASSSTNTTSIHKKTSVVGHVGHSKGNGSKINLQNHVRRNKNISGGGTARMQVGNRGCGSKPKNSYTNTVVVAKSSNVSRSKTERIISSPGNMNIKCHNGKNAIKYKDVKQRNDMNTIDNNGNKYKTQKGKEKSKRSKQSCKNNNKRFNSNKKMKSGGYSHRNIYSFLNKAQLSNTKITINKPKSKSPSSHGVLTINIKTRKTSPNNNTNIPNNITNIPTVPTNSQHPSSTNILNNIQYSSNQVNSNNHISSNSDILNGIHIHTNSILHSSIMRQKISQQQKQRNLNISKCSSNSKSRSNGSKPKQKFELNVKRLIDKKMFESNEAYTERSVTNSSKNSLLGSYSSNFYSTNRNNSSSRKGEGGKKGNRGNTTESKGKITEMVKMKLKSLYDINQLMIRSENKGLNNNSGFNSVINPRTDRNSKNRITFK